MFHQIPLMGLYVNIPHNVSVRAGMDRLKEAPGRYPKVQIHLVK